LNVEPLIVATEAEDGTTIGTSTTKTQLNGAADLIIPAWAKSIVSITAYVQPITYTASEATTVKLTLESDDIAIQPFEVVLTPNHAGIGTVHDQHAPKPDKWIINCPVQGGEYLKIYGTALVANTAAPTMGWTITFANKPPTDPQVMALTKTNGKQRYYKSGTYTNTGTGAGQTAGTAYTIVGATRIIEVYGTADKGGTLTASEPTLGYFTLYSPHFVEPIPLEFCMTPIPSGLGTIGTATTENMVRFKVDVPTQTPCQIQDYFNLEIGVTVTANWVTTVGFERN